MCVNQGRGTAVKILQRAINGKGGDLKVDGSINFTGDYIKTDTIVRVTEQMDISNNGSGPALIVTQHGAEDIFKVVDDLDKHNTYHEQTGISISKEMVDKYGPTQACRGCSWITGRSKHKQTHSDDCRKRFIDMSNEPGNEDLEPLLFHLPSKYSLKEG